MRKANKNIAPTLDSISIHRGVENTRYFYHTDHLGSSSWISNSSGTAQQYLVYLPFGETLLDRCANTNWNTMFSFSGKERDLETGYSYFGARYYDAGTSIWLSVDPMADKYPGVGPYNYCGNNPIRLIDPDGREPIKSQAGTARGFVHTFNTTGTYSGTKTGVTAHNAMLSYGKTDFNFPRPMPANTGKINNYADKYIYTEEGGWIDMTHFMFYAGKAYQNKMDGVKDPIGEAVQAGYMQEMSDRVFAPHSAYSYEDLPSDKFGAEFGAKYFDPDSKQTFGEQLENYLNNVLKATDPQSAPNYNQLPITEPTSKPSRINKTTTPVYTKDNP